MVEETEWLARFLPDSKMFSSNGVRSTAFMPRRGTTSVFRITGMDETQIRGIGNAVLTVKPPKARAEIVAERVYATGLQLDPDNTPEFHANITGWPPDSAKDEQKLLALQLASSSVLKRHD
ncbi:MAG TPA: hypothetical protein VFJ82_21205 [Longimicrobium sp.]|nr:hypothetical protein [Longimicrobium sp.]